MKVYIILISILWISCNESNESIAEKNSNLKVDTLIFASSGFNYGHKLKLATDNKFIDEIYWASCLGGGGKQKIHGTFISKNGKIILNPKTVHSTEIPMFENDSLAEKRITEYNPDSLKIETAYYLVEWRRNKYLLSEAMDPNYGMDSLYIAENDFIRFAQYFNSESRRFKFDGFLYFDNEHTCDSLNPKFDYNQIPLKWQNYFLKHPIIAEIEKVKLIEKEEDYGGGFYHIELNRGSKDKIFQGLYLSNKMVDIYIDSVDQNKSYSTIYLNKNEKPKDLIGSTVKTKWE